MGEERQAWQGAGQVADDAEQACELVGAARLVLVDFDGPLARLLPGDRWLEVAAEVLSLIHI